SSIAYTENILLEKDYRNYFSPKKEPKINFTPYIQVFGDRNGFTPNMSIVDILFNEGPNTVNYIKGLIPNV
ncbi:MAG: WbqC family protein, partial [Flavobacteriales bacterium]|nr:WbqC family protein [Flavobacteriales bacterium]